jgi:hypothetical protein
MVFCSSVIGAGLAGVTGFLAADLAAVEGSAALEVAGLAGVVVEVWARKSDVWASSIREKKDRYRRTGSRLASRNLFATALLNFLPIPFCQRLRHA